MAQPQQSFIIALTLSICLLTNSAIASVYNSVFQPAYKGRIRYEPVVEAFYALTRVLFDWLNINARDFCIRLSHRFVPYL